MVQMADLLSIYTTQSEMSSFFIDKMGIINVKSYGCTGDGATDDTTNFNLAIAALADYYELYVPHGTYLLTNNALNAITQSNVRIWGPGVLKATTAAGYFLRIQASNVTIDGLTFDGNRPLCDGTETAASAITIETPSDGTVITDITIKNCRIYNWSVYGIAVTENSTDNSIKNRIDNVKLINNYVKAGTIGIEVYPKTLSRHILVDGNYVEIMGTIADSTAMKPAQGYQKAVVTNNILIGGLTSGMALGIALDYAVISNNLILTSGTAVGINNTTHTSWATTAYIRDVALSDNIIISSAGVGLLINGKYDFDNALKISDNYIEGSTYSLYMQPVDTATENLSNVYFSKNIWNGNLKIFRSDDNSKVVKNTHFDGDIFNKSFSFNYIANLDLKNIMSENSTTFAGELVGCTDVSVSNGKIYKSTTSGLSVNNSDRVVIDNTKFIDVNTGNGAGNNCIDVFGGSDTVFIKNCSFINESGVGYAKRAIYNTDGTNVFIELSNTYSGMVTGNIYLGVITYAGMIGANRIHYATAIPSTEYAAATFAQYDRAIVLSPVEAGTAGSKYVDREYLCSVGGTGGTWLPQRMLTGN